MAVFVIDQSTDGLSQPEHSGASPTPAIASPGQPAQPQYCSAQLTAIHIVSHGESGSLLLGSGEITADELSAFSDQLSQSAATSRPTATFCCTAVKSEKVPAAASSCKDSAPLTGADIAASEDSPGASFSAATGTWKLSKVT
ncbi:MAG: DUF4347 domain-containing protein [Planctomycetaceae bacterium]